jgi:cobalt-precorrin-5B (C1)-methyltransferase
MSRQQSRPLRRGWTTGACAAAAARAAFTALLSGRFPDPVAIRLPRGTTASFPLALAELGEGRARAGVVKDAGDDPDVTHGAPIIADVTWAASGSGIVFTAGEGVGTVTRAGLPLAVGEPAINPAPRARISRALHEAAEENGALPPDVVVTISIPDGKRLAEKTMNARPGIIGGLSILGTTGIVGPYSCSSWIHSIRRGIDVACAAGLDHIAASTGATSEHAVQRLYDLLDHALIDLGGFVGGTLKYLRAHPVARLTITGGFAKLAGGHLALAGSRERAFSRLVAARAREVALAILSGKTAVEVAIVDREGEFLARVGG